MPASTDIAARLAEIPPFAKGWHNPGSAEMCACGCGGKAPRASRTGKGVRRGDLLRFISGHNSKRRPYLARYEVVARNHATPCWEWTGSINRKGYGRIQVAGVHHQAHRVAYEAAYGPIAAGMVIDHVCRNRCCIRPDHLEAVTSAENTRRGRQTKLRADQVALIRADGGRASEVAQAFGISRQTVADIRFGRRWANRMATAS